MNLSTARTSRRPFPPVAASELEEDDDDDDDEADEEEEEGESEGPSAAEDDSGDCRGCVEAPAWGMSGGLLRYCLKPHSCILVLPHVCFDLVSEKYRYIT
ncbi:hypothetical protein HDE_06814 [Halotydeus destructor]|nr:hypothetical protein HDE_06814 [Halotydeus destructor]